MRAIYDRLIAGVWPALLELRGEPEGPYLEAKLKADRATPDLDDGDRAHIGKAVCGLANADGGCLLFGVRAGRQGEIDRIQNPEPITNVVQCLLNVQRAIASMVEPPIAVVELESIDAPTAGQGIVALYVAPSDGGPHRVASGLEQGRYYMRAGSNTEIMPHTILADRFGRRPSPKLRLVADFVTATAGGRQWGISLRLRNEGRGTARQPMLVIRNPRAGLEWRGLSMGIDGEKWVPIYGRGNYRPGHAGWESKANAEVLIFPGTDLPVAHVGNGNASGGVVEVALAGTIYCADAQPVEFDGLVHIDAGEIVL